MHMYTIMNPTTGVYLPHRKSGRGFTYTHPVAERTPRRPPPRLFVRRSAAEAALRWWLAGPVVVHYDHDYGDPVSMSQTEDVSRKAWGLAVVRVDLVVPE